MENQQEYEYLFKCVLMGDGGVGKSTMLQRLITGEFMPMKMTIGADFQNYTVSMDNKVVRLQIWDFSGQEHFRFFLGNYCQGASGVLLCYDITRFSTFKNIENWYDLAKENTDNPIFILIGEKNDLEEYRSVSREAGESLKEDLGLKYFFETSSKSGINNKKIFEKLAEAILERKKTIEY
ncbi:MAG: Small GTP-binding domain protein [Promethearchaeota archaeon]|nr:MAG: Small GTP-binding domain protein [Candidatus Lokiarchaeota archaeon]